MGVTNYRRPKPGPRFGHSSERPGFAGTVASAVALL